MPSPRSVPFREAGSVLKLPLPDFRREVAPSSWLLVLRLGSPCGMNANGKAPEAGVHLGCRGQVYRLLSPPFSSLCFQAECPRPFLSPLWAAPPHSHAHWSSFLFSELPSALQP